MRVLGIDCGSKRIGVALSDETATIGQPLEFVAAEPLSSAFKRLADIVRDRQVGEIVVGLPRNMNGTYGPAAEKTREFVAALREHVSVPIKTWDERLTSAQANRVLIASGMRRDKRKTKVDQTAAAILLQSYLDRENQADDRV
jgi:putative Holliday junction resolvase